MANSKMYQIATKAQYQSTYAKSITKVANAKAGASTTAALKEEIFYGYLDGYTSNAGGSTQGTTNGYRIKVLVYIAAPNKTNRTVTYRVMVFFARTDGYTSTNTLNLTMKATKAKKTETASKYLSLSSSVGWVLAQDVKGISLSYPDSGNLTETIQITGNNSPQTSCSSITCKFTFQLPSIGSPLSAAFTSPNPKTVTLGSSATKMDNVKITADKADLKVTLKATLLNADNTASSHVVTILNKSTARTYSWTAPIEWAEYITDRASATAKITLTTYQANGTTKVGNSRNCNITVNVPTLEDEENPTGIKITDVLVTGKDTQKLVIGQSIPKVTVTLDKTNARGATVSKVECTVGNETITDDKETTIFQMKSKVVSEDTVVRVTVTDSRGRVSTISKSITAYSPLAAMSILSLDGSRGNGANDTFVANDEGTSLKVTFKLISPLIKSEGADSTDTRFYVFYQYRTMTEESFSVRTDLSYNIISINRGEGTATGTFYISGLSQANSYVVRLTASDDNFVTTQTREVLISTAFYFVEFHSSGTGIGIGQAANPSKLDINMPTQFHTTVVNSSGAAITSDERKKEDIKLIDPLIEKLLKLYKEVDPITFKYKEEVAKYQNDALLHFGFSANKFKDAMDDAGLDSNEFSVVQEYQDRKKDPNTMEDIVETFLAMKYDEITPLNFLMIKFILRELININDRLKEVEENGKNNDSKE